MKLITYQLMKTMLSPEYKRGRPRKEHYKDVYYLFYKDRVMQLVCDHGENIEEFLKERGLI